MEVECPRLTCLQPVQIHMIPSKCGALEYEAVCTSCGQVFSGVITLKPADPENVGSPTQTNL